MNMKSILYWYMNVMNKCIDIDECTYEDECDVLINECDKWMWWMKKLTYLYIYIWTWRVYCIDEYIYIYIWLWKNECVNVNIYIYKYDE